jgi:hypothetical protein
VFNILTNLTKAEAAVVLTPVAVVADIVTLPASVDTPGAHPFGKTGALLGAAANAANEAVKPDKDAR